MNGNGVVDAAPNSLLFQPSHQFVPFLDPDRIEVIHVLAVAGLEGRHDFFNPPESLIVLPGVPTASLIAVIKALQLNLKNCRLNAIHPAVPTDHRVVILLNLPVVAENPDLFLQFIIVSHDSAGFAKCAQILPRVKTETADIAHRTSLATLVLSPVRLGGIFDHEKTMLTPKRQDGIHIRDLPEKMNRNEGSRSARERLFKKRRVHCVSALIDVDEDRAGAGVSDRFGGGHKGIGHGNDLIARSNPASEQGEPKCLRSAADTNCMLRAAKGCELLFELLDKSSASERSAVDDCGDRLIELSPQRSVVRVKIEEGYSCLHGGYQGFEESGLDSQRGSRALGSYLVTTLPASLKAPSLTVPPLGRAAPEPMPARDSTRVLRGPR